VGVALCASAGLLLVMALAVSTGLMPVGGEIQGTVASVLVAVALVDLLMGFWFLRSSWSA
jgi:hypothetical protein